MQGFFDFMKSLGAARMAAMAAVTLALIGFFSFLMVQMTTPQMVPLFTDLSVDDSASIIKDLERQAVPYQIKSDGAIIMVPKDKVTRLRMKLAESGLPSGSDDTEVRLLCELGGSAGRNPLMASLLTTLYDRQVGMYQVVLEQGAARGIFTLAQPSLLVARNLVALEDAYGYRIIAGHPTIDHEGAFQLIVAYARLATGHALTPS